VYIIYSKKKKMNNVITSSLSLYPFNLLKLRKRAKNTYIHPVDVMTLFVSAAQVIEIQDKKVRNNVK